MLWMLQVSELHKADGADEDAQEERADALEGTFITQEAASLLPGSRCGISCWVMTLLFVLQGSELHKTGGGDEDDEEEEAEEEEEDDEDADEDSADVPEGKSSTNKVQTRRQKAIAEGRA